MKQLFILVSLLCLSCEAKKESLNAEGKKDNSVTGGAMALEEDEPDIQVGNIRIKVIKKGKRDSDFWETGLKDIRYTIYRDDSLLSEIEIDRNEFSHLYTADFGGRSRIWDSGILKVDTLNKKIIIENNFGLPESDNHTLVLCLADFHGTKSFMDSSPDCASRTNISFDKIVNCNGVYSYNGPVHEFDQCCTVFSDLINRRTLLYVIDWQKMTTDSTANAFFIDIYSKDTLDRFIFTDYTYSLGYDALIGKNTNLHLMAVLDSKTEELTVYDSLLSGSTFDLRTILSREDLEESLNTIEMYNEDYGTVIIEFNKMHQPVSWKKINSI